MAQMIAIALVAATVLGLVIDYVVTQIKRRRRSLARVACQPIQEHDTSSMERKMDEKIEEMETLKNLSGISGGLGLEVREALSRSMVRKQERPVSDSQIVKDIQEKHEELRRMAKAKTV